MATEEQWAKLTGLLWEGKPSSGAVHAMEVREVPLEAKAILDLVMSNLCYAGDHYYYPLWQPVEWRVAEFYASLEEKTPAGR